MTGLLQCDDLMQFQRLLKRNVWFNTFDVLFDFRALKQLRAIDDKIIYALNVSTPTASMQVVNILMHLQYFHVASILSGSRSWSETKMLGIENWARTKLQGLYINWLHWLIARSPPGQRRTYPELCLCHGRQGENCPGKDALAYIELDLLFSRSNVVFYLFISFPGLSCSLYFRWKKRVEIEQSCVRIKSR